VPEPAPRAGLLIDWFGVMTTSLFGALGDFCTQEGLAIDQLKAAFTFAPEDVNLLALFEEGRIDDDAFSAGLAARLGLDPARAEGMLDRMTAGATVLPEMVDLVRAARAGGIRTGLISNSWGAARYPMDLLEDIFDGVVISGLEGIRKPAPAIFTLGAQRVGLAPEACVFVDDLAVNLPAAQALGMATVHHRESALTQTALQPLLGVAL
jgi:epoxide hydrolase-like predicted phosphatase